MLQGRLLAAPVCLAAFGQVAKTPVHAANIWSPHGKFHISGCYYVKQPRVKNGQSGMIEFVNTRFDHHIHSTIGGEAFAAKFTIRPNEGDMIIFPSTLLHSVHPNETKEERISIAWNILFKKKTASASIIPKTAIFQAQKPTLKI